MFFLYLNRPPIPLANLEKQCTTIPYTFKRMHIVYILLDFNYTY